MARLNLEDPFWIEIMPLIGPFGGDLDKAIGNAVRFFRFAQEKHKAGRLITEEEFKVHGFNEALFPIFAERVDGGIKCRGAEKHFNWLSTRSESGAQGGAQRSEKKRQAAIEREHKKKLKKQEEQNKSDELSRSQANHKSTSKQHKAQPSSSSSSSSSSSEFRNSSNYEQQALESASAQAPQAIVLEPPKPKPNAGNVVKLYCDLWKARYQSPRSPDITGATAGRIRRLVADVGEARAAKLVEAFLQMPDSWFVTKSHSIPCFLDNITKVGLFADSGKMVSRTEANQLDRKVATANVRQQLREGKV